MFAPFRARPGRGGTGLVCLALLVALTGCTGGPAEPPADRPVRQPATGELTTGELTTLAPKPVPLRVRVTLVFGKLPRPARQSVQRRIGRVVGDYFDAAFLAGDYPRSDFGDAFATFTRGAAARARADRDLLTNRTLGPATVAVTPLRREAFVSVLAPRRRAVGATARVRLVFRAVREGRPDSRVRLTGRLMLTRGASGRWRIFGYDVARSTVPAGNRSDR